MWAKTILIAIDKAFNILVIVVLLGVDSNGTVVSNVVEMTKVCPADPVVVKRGAV